MLVTPAGTVKAYVPGVSKVWVICEKEITGIMEKKKIINNKNFVFDSPKENKLTLEVEYFLFILYYFICLNTIFDSIFHLKNPKKIATHAI